MKLVNVFMVGVLALALVACGGNAKDNLVGSWGVEDIDMSDMLAGMSDEEKAMYESFLPMMEEAMKSMEMTFNADGTMMTKASMMGQENEDKGTWELSSDSKSLITKNEGQEEADTIGIEKLDGKSMVLVMDADGSKMKMTMKKK